MTASHRVKPATWQLILAFAAVYLIWGSTYLGIRYAIETMPPFLMAGARFIIAGGIIYALTAWQGAPRPTRANWRATAIVGALLLMGGNGLVTFAEQRLPSGLAALLVSFVPLWMALLNWLRSGGTRPSLPVTIGLMVGLGGMVLLLSPGESTGGTPIDLLGVVAALDREHHVGVGALRDERAADPVVLRGVAVVAGRRPVEKPQRPSAHAGAAAIDRPL